MNIGGEIDNIVADILIPIRINVSNLVKRKVIMCGLEWNFEDVELTAVAHGSCEIQSRKRSRVTSYSENDAAMDLC